MMYHDDDSDIQPTRRFREATTDEDVQKLLAAGIPANNQKGTAWAVRIFSEWANQADVMYRLETFPLTN